MLFGFFILSLSLQVFAIDTASELAAPKGAAQAPAPKTACSDEDRVYKICSNQGTLLKEGLQRARDAKKKALVVFGAEWCGYCQRLHKGLQAKKYFEKYEIIPITLNEKGRPFADGYEALRKVTSMSKMKFETARDKGFPTVFEIDTFTGRAVYKPLRSLPSER